MAKIDIALIQQLRERTGLGMLDVKKALEETNGDIEKAIELLRKKGALVAAKRSDKTTEQGLVHAYIHPGALIGVLIEVDCETDFVARTDDIKQFAHDVCMHIAAMKPLYINAESVDPKFVEKEKEILKEQLEKAGKTGKIAEQIMEGKLKKIYSEVCLLDQPFVKNDKLTIKELLQQLIAKTGENIRIARFARYQVGGQ
jgi:elongation factor Ts